MKKLPKRIDVRFPPTISTKIDDLVKLKIYKNRSQAVRHLIEVGIENITVKGKTPAERETV